ncbi:hypothetical protein AAFF_G00324590 [Aldrovandia affinis]|uniref:Uncharacterized protein n=1 Tax=Aldrovandia affinis TaxID=143900 RepID=A0AAD7R6I7_9TELE|nr:hypothetical protein AAFF_G00324590 [Aldrovandia affinis]
MSPHLLPKEELQLLQRVWDVWTAVSDVEKAPEAAAERSHVFGSFFIKQLTPKDKASEEFSCFTAQKRRHQRMRTRSRNVDIFSKDYPSKDPHLPQYPTIICLHNIHSHNLFVADALRHRDVGDKAIETLTRLFEIGHSPTSALAVLKDDLQAEYGKKYIYASADRAICPDLQFCYRLYQKIFRQEYGKRKRPEMTNGLDLGSTYSYDQACRIFIMAIASCSFEELQQSLKSARFFSIMSDSSVD